MSQNRYNRKKSTNRSTDREVPGWILTISSSFLLLCAVFPIFLGPISAAVYAFLLGAFGFSIYPILACILTAGIFFIKGKTLSVSRLYVACSIFAALFVIFILHLATVFSMIGTRSFAEYTAQVYGGPGADGSFTGGGVVFGTLVYGLAAVLTPVFSFVVFSLVVLVLAFIMANARFGIIKAIRSRSAEPENREFQKSARSAAPVRKMTDYDLFVESIRPAQPSVRKFDSVSGTASGMAEAPAPVAVAPDFSVPVQEVTLEDSEKKTSAWERLYGGRSKLEPLPPGTVYPFAPAPQRIPAQAQSAPDIRQSASFNAQDKPPIVVHDPDYKGLPQLLPVIPEKAVSHVPGDIVNGAVESLRLSETSESGAVSQTSVNAEQPQAYASAPMPPVFQAAPPSPSEQSYSPAVNPRHYISPYTTDGFITQKFEPPKVTEKILPTPTERLAVPPVVPPVSSGRYGSFESELSQPSPGSGPTDFSLSSEEYGMPDYGVPAPLPSPEQIRSARSADHTGYYTPIEDVPVAPPVEPQGLRRRRGLNPENQVPMENYMAGAAKKEELAQPSKPLRRPSKYNPPPIEFLLASKNVPADEANADVAERVRLLEETLDGLKLPAKVSAVTRGPSVTRYELEMPHGIPVKRIEQYVTDIEYYLASNGKIRLETPIPGKRAVGIEVPNEHVDIVGLRDVIQSDEFQKSPSALSLAMGKDITGTNIVCELQKMPHLLIAGTTGSGKSACLNSIIMSLVYKSSPDDVRLILIDPKHVEFTMYKKLPHLLTGEIINDGQQALKAFSWLKNEMDRRYVLFAKNYVQNLPDFNKCAAVKSGDERKLPYIVLIVDELAELMMSQNRKDLEDRIMSMAQKARASGIHLVLATQRPTVDVITGTIRANLPSRVAFAVKSVIDSRIILDSAGAETLIGRGDMLYAPLGADDPRRVQGAYVTSEEVASVVEYVHANNESYFDDEIKEAMTVKEEPAAVGPVTGGDEEDFGFDPVMPQVLKLVIETGTASTSFIQRRFSVGFARGARIIDQMEQNGFIGPQDGSKARAVYITRERFVEIFGPEKYAEVFGEEYYEG